MDKGSGKQGKKGGNVVFSFAAWWINSFGTEQSYQSPEFRALLGKASRLRKEGYDLNLVKRTVRTMQAHGIEFDTPYAIKWASPNRAQNWYTYANGTIPPLWDGISAELYAADAMPLRVS